jgi:asparagine synthase (glutamine-hydrolysing)
MPGLVFIIKERKNTMNIEDLVKKMCNKLKNESWYQLDTFFDEFIAMARVSLGVINTESQPIFNQDKSLCIMLDGEIYDYQKLKEDLISKGHRFSINNDSEFVLHLYEEYPNEFPEKLRNLNGTFTFIIYNTIDHELLICNDRFGFKPLYWCKWSDNLFFASEMKAILQDTNFKREIDLDAVAEFFSFGYLLGNKTFLKNIELLPPASIFKYSNEKIEVSQYWSWKEIQKKDIKEIGNEEKVVNELGNLFIQAIERRTQSKARIGSSLSGGLDSRSIISAIPKRCYPLHAITFGNKDCDDYKIASRVCNKLGVSHHLIEITAEKWFSGIETTVYVTEGQLNVVHQHSWDAIDSLKEYADVEMNGFAGDLVIGGSYLKKSLLDKDIDADYIMKLCQVDIKMPFEYENEFYDHKISKKLAGVSRESLIKQFSQNVKNSQDSDYFFLSNHVRRFTLMGPICVQTKIESLKPFFDYDFIDYVYSLPSELRCNSNIYNKMLLKFFPETFRHIPWQKNGLPINTPRIIKNINSLFRITKLIVNISLEKLDLPGFNDNKNYADYSNWFRKNKKLKEYTYATILSERALKRGYFNPHYIKKLLDEHMSKDKDNSQIIGLLLTFELFNRMFLDGDVL